jgi:hypothetical protein
MRCGKCGNDNREGRKFCAKCGGPLARLCPKCGASNEPGEDFCGDCGGALSANGDGIHSPQAQPSIPGNQVATLEINESAPVRTGLEIIEGVSALNAGPDVCAISIALR